MLINEERRMSVTNIFKAGGEGERLGSKMKDKEESVVEG
jgi:hypothetical protein